VGVGVGRGRRCRSWPSVVVDPAHAGGHIESSRQAVKPATCRSGRAPEAFSPGWPGSGGWGARIEGVCTRPSLLHHPPTTALVTTNTSRIQPGASRRSRPHHRPPHQEHPRLLERRSLAFEPNLATAPRSVPFQRLRARRPCSKCTSLPDPPRRAPPQRGDGQPPATNLGAPRRRHS
jgi:hypothetical protein